ncbi:MAG: hypothetical protein IKD22_06760, partial [Lentisphaeria bacterium]|nr:hypothetical protein [Lentisphaeria bacterium]
MKSFILTLLSLCTIWCCGAEVTLKEYLRGDIKCIQVENQFYRIIILPQIGGKIAHWFDKVSNTAYVYTKLPDRLANARGHFGMLDDRSDFVSRNYDAQTAALTDEGKVVVALSAFSPNTKIKITKTLTFFADTPAVNVKYNYENFSNGNITGFALGIRNFFYPSGNDVSTDDRYYFPTTHTLRRLYGYTHKDESGETPVEMAAKLDSCLGAPYSALLNIPKQCGLAISFEDDFYNGFHIWKAGIKYPTYEWTYHFLPAGHSHKTEFNIIQVNGLDSVAYAAHDLLSAVKIRKDKKEISVKTDLKFLRVPSGALRLEVSCRAIGKKWNSKNFKFDLTGKVAAGKNATFNSNFTLPGNGLYEVEHRIYRKKILVDVWREAVTCGNFSTLPIYQFKTRKVTESAAIPGWKANDAPKEEVTPVDTKRGFTVFEPLQNDAYKKCTRLDITIARNEMESCELIVGNLNYLGNINVTAVNTGSFPVQVRVRRNLVRGGGGARPRIAKILFEDKKFELEEKQPVWLTVGSRENPVAPGKYSFALKFTGRNNTVVEIPVTVTVVDLLFPARNMVNLESEGYPQYFPGANNINVLNAWYKNMRDHGIDFFQHVRRGSKLNVKVLDHYIDNAIKYGLVIFKASRYDIRPAHPGEEEYWKALGEYLRQKGFQNKDMFVKILDEQPGEKFPAMAATGRWLKAAGFRPC